MITKHIRLWPRVLLVCVVIIIVIGWWWCFRPLTTVLVVRHAEKAAQSGNPSLSAEGQARAETLVHVAGDAGVSAIYATQFIRTQQTVEPLADHLGLSVNLYPATDVEGLVDQVVSDHAGEVILIAGHSNTVPAIIEELGGGPITPIAESEFDNLFILTDCRCWSTRVIHLNYGNPD